MAPRSLTVAMLVVVLATQPRCVAAVQERCPLLTENRAAPSLPADFAQLDGLLRHRALQMLYDARRLDGSATRSFRIYFGAETLPLLCGRIELARALAAAGQFEAAGRKYQALLVLSQLMELAIAVHATVEYADQVKELSLTLVRTTETFGNQMEPLLKAALSEDPARIAAALRDGGPAMAEWIQHLKRWTAHIQADAEWMKVAKAVWDITIGVIAAYETAGALAEVVATGGPPLPPFPALAGSGAAAMELSGAGHIALAEAIRRLVALGALDAGVVVGLSTTGHMSVATSAPESLKGKQVEEYQRQVEQYGSGGVKVLENGRIRFYGEIAPATKSGEMAGRRMVREWDPVTGAKRTWFETLDHEGRVRQVRPDPSATNDQKVHYMFDRDGNYTEKW